MKAATPAVRITLVNGILSYAKTYTESAEFAQAYLKARDAAKPSAPTLESADEEWAKMLKDMEKGFEDIKKMVASPGLSADIRKTLEQTLQASTKQYEQTP